MRTFEEMILSFISTTERVGMEYVIVGGAAVSSWGNPRTTRDLDVILVLRAADAGNLCDLLKSEGFLIEKTDIENALKEKTHFSIFDTGSEYHVDAKGVYSEFDALTVKNKHTIQYKGRAIYVASAEDTIAHKLVLSGPQDIEDAESILLRQPHLDMLYLEQLCQKLGVADDLSRMKKEMGNSIR